MPSSELQSWNSSGRRPRLTSASAGPPASVREPVNRLAAIVSSSDDAIVSKTLEGVVTTWNAAAERLFGYPAQEMIGQSIRLIIPDDRQAEEDDIIGRLRRGERIEHFETVRRRKDGSFVDISLTVSPLRDASGAIIGAAKIARDITRRKAADAQLQRQAHYLATLNQVSRIISRDLDLERIVQSVTDIATELAGARFGAFFYNVTDGGDESYTLYTLSGAPRSAFESFGMPRNTAVFRPTFEGTEIVRSADIRKDARYGGSAPHHGMPEGHLPVVSYMAVPVVSSSGEVIGGLFFGHEEPAKFSDEAEVLVSAVAGQAAVAIDNARLHRAARLEIEQRRRAEDAQELLLDEIRHRVKNTLATVQAMASQTFQNASAAERQAFGARLSALAEANDLLTRQGWESTSLDTIVESALRPFRQLGADRIASGGPDVRLSPARTMLIAMVLHELGTNAVKYGALSRDVGEVDIRWSVNHAADRVTLVWREAGGPAASPPTQPGFGTRMIERALKREGGASHFDFAPAGLAVTVELPISVG